MVLCWSCGPNTIPCSDTGGPFTFLDSGASYSCGLQPDGDLACWGTGVPLEEPLIVPGPFDDVSVGWYDLCARHAMTGEWSCWSPQFGKLEPPTPAYGHLDFPADGYEQVSLYAYHACGILEGELDCWGCDGEGWEDGWEDTGACDHPEMDDAVSVGTGLTHSCAQAADGSVSCWGCAWDDFGQCDVPEELTGAR